MFFIKITLDSLRTQTENKVYITNAHMIVSIWQHYTFFNCMSFPVCPPGTYRHQNKCGGNAACHWQPYWESEWQFHGLHWRNFALVKQRNKISLIIKRLIQMPYFFTSFLNDKYFKSTWDLTAQCQFKSKLLIPIISVNQINIVCKMINLYTLSI